MDQSAWLWGILLTDDGWGRASGQEVLGYARKMAEQANVHHFIKAEFCFDSCLKLLP